MIQVIQQINKLHRYYTQIKGLSYIFVLLLTIISCSTSKKTENNNQASQTVIENIIYQASYTRLNDVIHTKLEVSFDWEQSQLCGKATIKLKPYFYPTNKLVLDAKGMELKTIELVSKTGNKKLTYLYDSLKIKIELDREYTKQEEYEIFIEYVAKPNDLEEGGSEAITSDKGLYFINPKKETPNKPQQIWTQGETEASSCWFPTIDSPNEKMTQEIAITVNSKYKTLSNGVLISKTINEDGTRTDYWVQNINHAPYLAMMAVGEFAIVPDNWRNKEVNYYVEKEYEPYARQIFGNTPEMIELFSKKLGYDYPWDKYNQIVVRDYVSGAMENSGAVVFGEFMQRNSRELLDRDDEDIIAHELFHHWFGDLVTCESWSNLPLNESFATYGEIIWIENKYGKDAADHHIQQDLKVYLNEAKEKQVDLIRFDYEDKEDMFDRHTYQKGGRVLHMLRNYVGDDAFFASLKKYLHDNAFKSVEIHNLRLAFEEVTGEDLNWFFNQWFLASGHPILHISYSYNDSTKQQTVTIQQKQDIATTPIYKLPINIDIYGDSATTKHKITVTKQTETFTFNVASKPKLVNVDADKILLCEKLDFKPKEQWVHQYNSSPLYLDKYEALTELANLKDSTSKNTMLKAFDADFWNIRNLAILKLDYSDTTTKKIALPKLKHIAVNDPKSAVRANALAMLIEHYKKDSLTDLYNTTVNDSAYSVVGKSLLGIVSTDSLGVKKIANYENTTASSLLVALANIYSEKGDSTNNQFYQTKLENCKGFDQYSFFKAYNGYIVNQNDSVVERSLSFIENHARNNETWYLRLAALRGLQALVATYDLKVKTIKKKHKLELQKKEALQKKITNLFDEISKTEKDEQVKKYLGL